MNIWQILEHRSGKKEFLKNIMDDDSLGIPIEELGITLEDLNNPEFQHDITEEEFSFNTSQSFDKINLYKYTSDEYGASEIGSNSRDFCINLANKTNVSLMTYKDILKVSPNKGLGQGGTNIYSVFKFRGGKNCKHKWTKFVFDTETLELVKSTDQPNQVSLKK